MTGIRWYEAYRVIIKQEAKSNSAQECRHLSLAIAFEDRLDKFNKFGIKVNEDSLKENIAVTVSFFILPLLSF